MSRDTDGKPSTEASVTQAEGPSSTRTLESTLRDPANPSTWLLDAIVETLPNMIFVKDAKRLAFTHFNRAGEELLGIKRESLLGKTDFDLFPKEDAEFFQQKDRETLNNRVLVDIPAEPIQTSRGLRWLHTKKVPILDDNGEPRYLLGISEDITERQAADSTLRAAKNEAEAASTELESFAYSVAHDLRAPLRGIDGYSQALIEDYGDRLDEEGQRYLRNVRVAAQRMAMLIDDLLTLSRVTRGEIQRETVNLSSLARAATERLRRADPKRSAMVDVKITEGLMADADARLLGVLLDNLLGNSWKFTGKIANPEIVLGVMGEPESTATVYFVRDNGAGFDMRFKEKLFGPFQRLHSPSEFDGTGIGLATVERIVRRHGGRVWAEGKVGEGATFYFTLTRGAAEDK